MDWLYPFVLSTLSSFFLFFLRAYGDVPIYADGALLSKILGFVQILPGFYIAALAAIATFNKIDIDQPMPSPAPKIDVMVYGKTTSIDLTRRRFLCSMFAFLTAESLLIIVMTITAQTIYLPIRNIVSIDTQILLSIFFIFILFFTLWQMIVTSFWGLFYLGERLHQPDL